MIATLRHRWQEVRACSWFVPAVIVQGAVGLATGLVALDANVLNDLDRFHLVMDTVDRVPQAGGKGIALKKQLQDKRVEHRRYIDKNGQDLPELRNWKWRLNHA